MMDLWRADLHCHSQFSDGTDSALELINIASKRGLKGLAITDHDNCDSYNSAKAFAEEKNLLLLPGIEFSASYNNESVHLLAYSFIPNHSSIKKLCEKHQTRRHERALGILEKLKNLGMPIPEDIILKKNIGRPHIAMAMMEKGYVSSIAEAFKLYLGKGEKAYVTGETISIEETLQAVQEAKGLAVIAHPHLIKNSRTVKALLKYPFDGIECYYALFPLKRNQPWLNIAHQKKWLITGGSDYHGHIKPNFSLGSSWVPKELFDPLWGHFLKNRKETCL